MTGPLVIVPCGRAKIWDRHPETGPVRAREAYTGYPFRLNVAYAERFAARWVILSAKYGLIDPDFTITGPYDVTFNRKSSNPIAVRRLRAQAVEMGLHRLSPVVGLGGRRYREIISEVFSPFAVEICFPFAGLPLGKAIRATRLALDEYGSYTPTSPEMPACATTNVSVRR